MAFLCAEMIRSTPFHPPASWCGHGDTAAYTKDNDPVGFVRNSEVLYTSENEKRTTALLRTLGFQMPSELQRYGSIGSITYADGGVKFAGVPFTEIEASSGSLLASDDAGQIKQKQESADTVLKTEEGGERPSFPAKNNIAQENAEGKKNTAAPRQRVRRKDGIFVFQSRRMPTERATSKLMKIS